MTNLNNPLQVTKIWMPESLELAVALKKQYGLTSTYVAGATLLQLKWQSVLAMPQHHICLEKITELKQVKVAENGLKIGALTSLSTLRFDPIIKRKYPVISEAVKSIAAPAVRNRGTIGGNVMGGEGDLIPLFLALQAEMTFLQEGSFKTMSIADWIQNGHSQDDLLVYIFIPMSTSNHFNSFYKKIGRRETFTAAIVTVSGQVKLSETNTINEICLAIGGGSNKPIRLVKAEQYMEGKTIDQMKLANIYQYILDEYNPASDAFVTGNYKKKVAANLIISELQRLLNTKVESEGSVYEM